MPIVTNNLVKLIKLNAAETGVTQQVIYNDVPEFPALKLAIAKNLDGTYSGLSYFPIVNQDDNVIIAKIYDSTNVVQLAKLSLGGINTSNTSPTRYLDSIVSSSDIEAALENDTLAETQVLSASATKSLIDSLISIDDQDDEAFATAAAAAVSAAFAEADVALQTALDAEISRAQTAEASNTAAINTEATRAQAAEATLQGNIDAEATARAQAITAAIGDVDLSGIATNATNISAEVTRAQAAEATLQGSIDAIPGQIAAAIAANDTVDAAARAAVSTAFADADIALQQSLDAEVTRAQTAEATLQGNIDAEATARAQAITDAIGGVDLSGIATNATNISAEVTRAQAAEATLQGNIDAEATARAQAITDAIGGVDLSGIATNTTNISAEVTRAQAAEATLQGNIDANTALIQAIEGGADIAQVGINTTAIATNAAAISNEIDARTASDLLLQADILTLDDKFDTLVSSSIPASYLLKVDGNDVVISTDGINTGNDDPDPNNLTAIQELYAQINSLITQALPSSTMFKPIGADYVVTGFLTGHAGGSLLEFSTGDIILPTAPTGFPEEAFRLSNDYTEIIFGE